jgi:signal transduction histidine kinase
MCVLTLTSLVIAISGVVLVRANWQWRDPGSFGWTLAESVLFTAGWTSVVTAEMVGLYLWWRSPGLRTGFWLWLAGASLGLWFVGTYWPNPWGMQLTWGIYVFRLALAMAILGWPTGRPTARIRRWIIVVSIGVLLLGTMGTLFASAPPGVGWPDDPVGRFDVAWAGQLAHSVLAWAGLFAPAVAVVVVLVRQRRALPRAAARLVTPLTVAGVIVALTDVVTVILTTADQSLLFDDFSHHETLLGATVLTVNYAQGALAAVGLLIACRGRRRVSAVADRLLEIDLGRSSTSSELSVVLPSLLGDPSARSLYPVDDGRWVDITGAPARVHEPDRAETMVIGRNGEELAMIEYDDDVLVHRAQLQTAAATIVSRLANETASALARARQLELIALQHAVLDASDSARRQLERDLHDGAQQRLVGLALTARLLARTPSRDGRAALHADMARAATELQDLVERGVPSVLGSGLHAGLMTLAATAAIPVRVRVDEDVPATDPLTVVLWFIACEAVANSIKHAAAREVRVEVTNRGEMLRIVVADDGCGGVAVAPAAIVARTADAGGRLSFASPRGAGTVIEASFVRAPVAVG